MAQFEHGELALAAVGRERGDAQPVDVGEAQLRAGARSFLAGDDAHVFGPALEVEQAGEFGEPRAVPNSTVAVERDLPDVIRDQGEELGGVAPGA